MEKLHLKESMLYPLRFATCLVPRVWGGESLRNDTVETTLPIGEKWLLSSLGEHATPVLNGAWQGETLSTLLEEVGEAILGKAESVGAHFPLLVKLIDAQDYLSIQVHPTEQAAQRAGLACGKDEMWVVLQAEADAKLYIGWEEDVTLAQVQEALAQGTLATLLHEEKSVQGASYFVPAGTVHAIGAGQLILEIQQPSDTTYRLYDWDRVDALGNARELHVSQAFSAMHCTSYQASVTGATHTVSVPSSPHQEGVLEPWVEGRYFVVNRMQSAPGAWIPGHSHIGYPTVLVPLTGSWEIAYGEGLQLREQVHPLELVLLPAHLHEVYIRTHTPHAGVVVAQPR